VLEKQIKDSNFDWVSANIKQGKNFFPQQYIIKKYGKIKVAIIGVTTNRSTILARPDKSLTFISELEGVKDAVKIVRTKEKANVVIILSHLGSELEVEDQTTSLRLAEGLEAAGLSVDLIVDGHSHTKFEEPLYIGGIPIVSANEWGKFMGEAIFTIKGKAVEKLEWKPIEITTEAFPPDPAILALLQPYIDASDESLKEVVMQTTDEFVYGNRISRYQETAAGDLVADAFVWFCDSIGYTPDFAITNGGGIRAALPKGDVTREAILTMLPFDNFVFVENIPGSKVKELFNFIGTLNQGAGGFPQVSDAVKYTITYDTAGTNGVVSDVLINGAPIDDNKMYKVATNDYMAGGGDGYTPLVTKDSFNSSMLLSSVVIDYVAANFKGPVTPKTYGRITVVGGTTP
jgi:5'-nucleotidase/UDP-sugar diphosphatase